MSRTADYTIQGFLYQFNKTILEILRAQDDEVVTVEGIVEDIDVESPLGLTAVQCKYHEASTTFAPSKVYKPILQMLYHFSNNQEKSISYVLFAHFPKINELNPSIDRCVIESALASVDKTLKKYIDEIPVDIDVQNFINRFSFKYGPSYDDITLEVIKELSSNGIPKENIDTITYPNAIHKIAKISIQHNIDDRRITKREFLSGLSDISKTAISRWTLALKTRTKLLQIKRKELKRHLNINSRLRYIIINPYEIENYENEIVGFISDFIDKYHFKTTHIYTPILCLRASHDEILDIQHRLYTKGIVTTDGYIGGKFEEDYFFRDPFTRKSIGDKANRDFNLRVLSWDEQGSVLNHRKCDDLYIFGKIDCENLDTVDINVVLLEGATIREIKYILGVSDVYE